MNTQRFFLKSFSSPLYEEFLNDFWNGFKFYSIVLLPYFIYQRDQLSGSITYEVMQG